MLNRHTELLRRYNNRNTIYEYKTLMIYVNDSVLSLSIYKKSNLQIPIITHNIQTYFHMVQNNIFTRPLSPTPLIVGTIDSCIIESGE